MAAAGGDGEPPGDNYNPYAKDGPDPADEFDDLKPEKRARLVSIAKRDAPYEQKTAASVKKKVVKKKNEGTLSGEYASSSTRDAFKGIRKSQMSSSSNDSGSSGAIGHTAPKRRRRASNSDSDIEGRERRQLSGFNPEDTPVENRVNESGSSGMEATRESFPMMIPIKEDENEMEDDEDNGDNDEDDENNEEDEIDENNEEDEIDENNEEDEIDENDEDDETPKRQDPDASPGGSDADDRLISS